MIACCYSFLEMLDRYYREGMHCKLWIRRVLGKPSKLRSLKILLVAVRNHLDLLALPTPASGPFQPGPTQGMDD
jgi:hypothetical protein